MEVKKDILWRVYLSFLGIVVFGLLILGRAIYIQQVQGPTWISMANEQQEQIIELEAERGTIFSEEGNMLSTSIPYYDLHIDFAADGLRAKNGKIFKEHVDSLSIKLAGFFKDKSASEYKKLLQEGYRKKDRYFLLRKDLHFRDYILVRQFPLLRLDPNKGGFIVQHKPKRLTPYQLLANRTIGLSREYEAGGGKKKQMNVGLEFTYDSILRGEGGERLVRKISPGVFVPVQGAEIEPMPGKDIVTTIDVNIQDIAETALLKMMLQNECEYGTCIVMEVATGKIKAMANLGQTKPGNYWENLNYAIQTSEPGSTFKLATMLALFEDKYVTPESHVNLEGGKWMINGRTVWDSERHGLQDVTVKQAFEHSSNVGMAKLAMTYYAKNPNQFVEHLKRLNLHEKSGIDLAGEGRPVIKNPSSRTWSATSLPWMSFGYEVLVSPLQTLMLYNAVANNGKMMKPYLVNAIQQSGITIKSIEPVVLEERVASENTLKLLKSCLEGVCNEEGGTGFGLFKGTPYKVAGKTGTALMANGNRGYSDHIYQSSFAGYFPAKNPKYSCIVVIRNKPFAPVYYGAKVAGPVFKEVADKLFALQANKDEVPFTVPSLRDSSTYLYAGATNDMKKIMSVLEWKYTDSANTVEYGKMYASKSQPVLRAQTLNDRRMPDVQRMGLKDALYLLEQRNLMVTIRGRGKVARQSIEPGTVVPKKTAVVLELE